MCGVGGAIEGGLLTHNRTTGIHLPSNRISFAKQSYNGCMRELEPWFSGNLCSWSNRMTSFAIDVHFEQ